MNAGNVGCSWPAKCRCLRKETLIPVQSCVVPTQTASQSCWDVAPLCENCSIGQSGPQLCHILWWASQSVRTSGCSSDGFSCWGVIFTPLLLQTTSMTAARHAQVCMPSLGLITQLSGALPGATPPFASIPEHPQAANWLSVFCQRCRPCVWLAVTLHRDKSSLCSANLSHP